jgi:hypothetical protein
MKAREILLALALIVFGVVAYYAKSGRLEINLDGGPFWGTTEEFLFDETQDLAGPPPQELHVINAHGAVEVRGAETDRITVTFRKSIHRKNREEAAKVADQLKMTVNRDGGRIILSTNRDDFRRKGFETRFTITVPAGQAVLIRNSYGPVKAEKTGTTDIVNPHGQVQAGDISGRLSVEAGYEDVDVHGLRDGGRIAAPHAKIIAVGVQGELFVEGSYGEIFVENADRNVHVEALHSAVTGRNLKGEVEIRNSYDAVTLSGAGPTKIFGHHSDVAADGIDGPLEIGDGNARLVIAGLNGDLRIEGNNLAVRAQRVLANDIFISSSYENIDLLEFTGKAAIVLKYADVTLAPASFAGPIDVRGDHAGVKLGWPAGAQAPFEAETKSGAIRWNLGVKPSFEQANGTSVTRAFTGAAGPLIRIQTTYGDITIDEGPKAIK